ncbi:hypothetical protein GCM10010124_01460 [Pilimelia terevasa]|uniref:Uncharacterized protein n=1 Tax=Pilimelia terevasa TaxID=53372 RepID=A0A8J3BD10_9ACTN|nr:hypothetical protein GCM10010124_01460 [Pilimelia terevasa]
MDIAAKPRSGPDAVSIETTTVHGRSDGGALSRGGVAAPGEGDQPTSAVSRLNGAMCRCAMTLRVFGSDRYFHAPDS